jgi:hypothetical protein
MMRFVTRPGQSHRVALKWLRHGSGRQVYRNLKAQEIHPQLYGLKWARLMFCREYTMEVSFACHALSMGLLMEEGTVHHVQDVLVLWDYIFASRSKPEGYDLVSSIEIISVSMVRDASHRPHASRGTMGLNP